MFTRKLTTSSRASPKRRLARLLVLLALTVLVPGGALLWLLDRTVSSERIALEQEYRSFSQEQVDRALTRWEALWRDAETHWSESTRINEILQNPIFAAAARVDPETSAFEFPLLHAPPLRPSPRSHLAWTQAQLLEFKDHGYDAAERLYHSIESTNPTSAEGRAAWQARVRCLVKGERGEEALELWRETSLVDPTHRELWETALYLSRELAERTAADDLRNKLRAWLEDETSSARSLPINRRLFMMEALAQAKVRCRNYQSEQRLATLGETSLPARALTIEAVADQHWMILSLDRRSIVLLDPATLTNHIAGAHEDSSPITLHPPGGNVEAYVQRPLTGPLAGWQIAVEKNAARSLAQSAPHPNLIVWVAWLALAASAMVAAWLCRAIFQEAKLNSLKNDFLAAVSHELKTPVTAIGLLVENLERKGEARGEVAEYLGLIGKENERLRRLIDNFLSFSRMERQKHHFTREPVALREIMDEAVVTVRERYPEGAQKIIEAPLTSALFLDGDREALTTVLVNLIDNALKYSRHDVQLDLDAAEQEVSISVIDRGIGLNAEQRSQVFDKFYRADPSLTNEATGVGLGLSIVDFVVRAHQGEITISSQPGEGSRFTVRLPLRPNLNEPDATPA